MRPSLGQPEGQTREQVSSHQIAPDTPLPAGTKRAHSSVISWIYLLRSYQDGGKKGNPVPSHTFFTVPMNIRVESLFIGLNYLWNLQPQYWPMSPRWNIKLVATINKESQPINVYDDLYLPTAYYKQVPYWEPFWKLLNFTPNNPHFRMRKPKLESI